MFGRNKQKATTSQNENTNEQETGAIIQGFVCPMCLLSFSKSHELEVHFQMAHDNTKVEDDEMVLLRQQLSASDQTRDLMQREIARHLKSIKELEESINTISNGRSDIEHTLQSTLSELEVARSVISHERSKREEIEREKASLESKVVELEEAISLRVDASSVEELSDKIKKSNELLDSAKTEASCIAAAHADEISKLQSHLIAVQTSYADFMGSLSKLVTDLETVEDGRTSAVSMATTSLSPECADFMEKFSGNLKKQVDERLRLKNALLDHETSREKFLQERSKLEDQLRLLEAKQFKVREKLLEVSKSASDYGASGIDFSAEADDLVLLQVLQRSVDSLQNKNEQLTSEIEQNISDEDVLKRMKQEYETTLSEKSLDIRSLQSDLDVIRQKEQERENANQSLRENLSWLEKEHAHISEEKCSLEVVIKKQKSLLTSVLQKLHGPSKTLTSDADDTLVQYVQEILDKNEAMQLEISRLSDDLEQHESRLRTNDEALSTLKDDFERKCVTVVSLESLLEEKKTESENNLNAISSLEGSLEQMKIKLDQSLEMVKSQEEILTELRNVKSSGEEKCQELSTRLENALANVEMLESSLKSKETELADVSGNLATLQSQFTDAESRLTIFSEASKESQVRLEDMEKTISTLKTENQRLASDYSSTNQQLLESRTKLTEFEQKLVQKHEVVELMTGKNQTLQLELEQLKEQYEFSNASLSSQLIQAKTKLEEAEMLLSKEKLVGSELTAELRMAQESNRANDKLITELSSLKNAATEEASLFRRKAEELEKSISSMKMESMAETMRLKSDAEKQLLAKEQSIHSQYADLENKLRSEMAGLLSRFEQSQNDNQDLEDELSTLQRHYNELQLALQELGREQQNLQLQTHRIKEQRWVADADAASCSKCEQKFSVTLRRHHCRRCGMVFCHACSAKTAAIGAASRKPVRVCDSCYQALKN